MPHKKYLHKIKHHVKKSVDYMQLNSRTHRIIFLSAFFCSFFMTLIFLSGLFTIPVLSFKLPYTPSIRTSNDSTVYDPYLLYKVNKEGTGEILIVDIRSKKEFSDGHIRGSINIPAYKDLASYKAKDKLNAESLVNDFKKNNPNNKQIVVYGHSQFSQLPQQIGDILLKKNIKVSILGIGWNEWRHFRNLWLPEAEWDKINIEDIVELQN